MSETLNPLDILANEYAAQEPTIYDKQLSEAMMQLENAMSGTADADEARGNILLAMNANTRESFRDGLLAGLRLARAEG